MLKVVMRGLLNPEEMNCAEEGALAKAQRDADIFQKNTEFLAHVLKRGEFPESAVKKHPGLKMVRENYKELASAKEEYERVQEELAAAAAAAAEEEREKEEREKKMKKLGR